MSSILDTDPAVGDTPEWNRMIHSTGQADVTDKRYNHEGHEGNKEKEEEQQYMNARDLRSRTRGKTLGSI